MIFSLDLEPFCQRAGYGLFRGGHVWRDLLQRSEQHDRIFQRAGNVSHFLSCNISKWRLNFAAARKVSRVIHPNSFEPVIERDTKV